MPDETHSTTDAPPTPPRWMEAIGWIGTFCILGAYGANSMGWLDTGRPYQLLNLVGAFGVGLICWTRRTWQAFALEAAWGTIALVALLRSTL